MKISGFTFVRNGFTFAYPFEASILSLLPIVDELVVVVGDSNDGTREAVEAIGDEKIRIIDSVWDADLRNGGQIFAKQTNLGLDHISGDWAFHLQVDEVLHEKEYPAIKEAIDKANRAEGVDGILFPFYHFWGDYGHIRDTRATHKYEIRAFKMRGCVRSYRDSQGFRKYSSVEAYENGEEGEKLNVIMAGAKIFHYSYTRHPRLMKNKSNYFHRFWHSDDWVKKNTDQREFDFNEVDRLDEFKGTHPRVMKDVIEKQDWDFTYDPSRAKMNLKERILHFIERKTGKRLFAYKNYRLIEQA